jgi:IS605 OrfB family transposase
MNITLKIKLEPTEEQKIFLLQTLKETNDVCNLISDFAWGDKIFNKFKLHYQLYHKLKNSTDLSSQMLVRCFQKVSSSYKVDKKRKRIFKEYGSIAYDSRILTYNLHNNIISIWCIGGRQKIKFVTHNQEYLKYIKGEGDLVYKKGKFYIYQTINVPEKKLIINNDYLGIDMGITDIIVTSDNLHYSSDVLNEYREKRQRIRSSLQSKGTKGCKKLLKQLSGKERTHSSIINHTISKQLVNNAIETKRNIVLEDLKGIRFNNKRNSKKFRIKLGKWNFSQLRQYIEYKSKINGVQCMVVQPNYTSQTCNCCKHIGKRNGKEFKCENCGLTIDADYNAALNISLLGGAINRPEQSTMYCCI